jgi:hypothetical protein
VGRGRWNGSEVRRLNKIKRFWHSRNKDAIRGYVDERLDVTGLLALDIPLAVHQLIARGISHFTVVRAPR